jgi:carboxymethylenebutenolidase
MTKDLNLKFNNKDFPAYISEPSGDCKGGLIVIQEVWGLSEHIKDVSNRFAAEGYLVLAPDLLSDTGISEKLTPDLAEELFDPERRSKAQPKLRELMTPMRAPGFAEETIEKLKVCFNYLFDQPMSKHKVSVTGFCFGGTYSFCLATVEPRLKAAATFYGHSDHSVEELKKIECPVVAFYGEQDERLINSLPELNERMEQASVDFNSKVYPNCGHAFFNDTNRFAYNAIAAEDAWNRVLKFLKTNE